MAIVTGDRYLEKLVKFVEEHAGPLIEGSLVLKLNPAGLHYVQSRLESLHELESLLAGAPVDYLRAYVSDLGDHRALEQLRRILRLLTSLKVVSVLPLPTRDPTPLSFLPFGRLKVLELRGCDLSTSAAKGLLELRHTLERIICHNSTDALRHVFANRIADIKDCPQWKRLSFVSCACNGLVLMDESLQLLPVVETLDLSRNKFTKVDNLHKCTKLKHLDLGFNHLRTISSFSKVVIEVLNMLTLFTAEPSFTLTVITRLNALSRVTQNARMQWKQNVSGHIVKLVLRNNALTTLHGIENLKSLEGLDVSYNIISNLSELEFLTDLVYLRSLWLEGNPLCCARWYRAQVFSFFIYPEKLKLDDKEISTREFWKRQIIIASKHKQPASFGFYLPAKDKSAGEGNRNRTRKPSRLARIQSGDEIGSICSDQDSVSCGNEIQNREDPLVSDDEAEVVGLINRVENLKKERSILWLREFKEWMDISSEDFVEISKEGRSALYPQYENYIRNVLSKEQPGEASRYAGDSIFASGDESSMNILESDNSSVMSASFHNKRYIDFRGSIGNATGSSRTDLGGVDQDLPKFYPLEGISSMLLPARSSNSDTTFQRAPHIAAENVNILPLNTVNDISGSHSSSVCPTSPPHYQEDLLHRRQYLVEEILQLSADSFSVASSDSNTSCCSEVDLSEIEPSALNNDNFSNINYVNGDVDGHKSLDLLEDKFCNQSLAVSHAGENDIDESNSSVDQTSKQCSNDFVDSADNDKSACFVNQEAEKLEKRKSKKKAKRRVVSILEECSDSNACNHESEIEQDQSKQSHMPANFKGKQDGDDISEFTETNCSTQDNDE
ncbi:Serine/threonine-protein kinase 11-interacting protein isoform B [Senna tora]|uniref:Serine/threonine-protein kinase 11-interacting protein isoform B n=1 Tax=Senna tora TaxID=362788 RepID=A0A834T482_9FABA|nr:Serine/threonine-protein kinase 11-interacting protein isoform B [Senna tora]